MFFLNKKDLLDRKDFSFEAELSKETWKQTFYVETISRPGFNDTNEEERCNMEEWLPSKDETGLLSRRGFTLKI